MRNLDVFPLIESLTQYLGVHLPSLKGTNRDDLTGKEWFWIWHRVLRAMKRTPDGRPCQPRTGRILADRPFGSITSTKCESPSSAGNGSGFRPSCFLDFWTWAIGPDWYEAGPLVLKPAPEVFCLLPRQRRIPYQPGPAARVRQHMSPGGLKARSKNAPPSGSTIGVACRPTRLPARRIRTEEPENAVRMADADLDVIEAAESGGGVERLRCFRPPAFPLCGLNPCGAACGWLSHPSVQ